MSSDLKFQSIVARLDSNSRLFSRDSICDKPTAIVYDKEFKWQWLATQLNTFIIISNFAEESVSPLAIEKVLFEAFGYAKLHYNGWPRGVQSNMAIIAIAISEHIEDEAVIHCNELRSKKRWAGFSIPVAIDAAANKVHFFKKYPMRGIIYYPHFKKLITEMTE